MSTIDEIKQKTDILEVIGQYTRLTKSGKSFKGLCPFHSEKHGSFFVYPEQQSWHCFGACGTGGDVFSFIMKKENCDFNEAKKILAERAGIIIIPEFPAEKQRKEQNERLYLVNNAATEYYHQLLLNSSEAEKVRQYLAQRGLNAQSVETFKLGYSPNSWDNLKQQLIERGFNETELLQAGLITEGENKLKHDRFRHRLMFPIADIKGRIIGFGGRALEDSQQPKYLNSSDSPLFHKAENLYALHLAKDAIRKQDQAVIVEGYMDVILPYQYGFTNIVASMGTAIGESHAQIIRKITRNLVLALDADDAGEEATLRSVSLENSFGAEMRVAILPAGKDPDEIIVEDAGKWRELISSATPIIDYFFERVLVGLDLKSAQGKSLAVEKLLPVVRQINDIVRQTYYVNKLAELTGVNSKKLVLNQSTTGFQTVKRKSAPRAEAKKMANRPIEDYCLSLLLKHPELREQCQKLLPEYFENSENREILQVILQVESPEQQKAILDSSLWEHYDTLYQKNFPGNQLAAKLHESILRLREEYLKQLAQHREDIPATEESDQLRQVFIEKEQMGMQKRRQSA
jgi:DNA primase